VRSFSAVVAACLVIFVAVVSPISPAIGMTSRDTPASLSSFSPRSVARAVPGGIMAAKLHMSFRVRQISIQSQQASIIN
jgi:hypothetical protein